MFALDSYRTRRRDAEATKYLVPGVCLADTSKAIAPRTAYNRLAARHLPSPRNFDVNMTRVEHVALVKHCEFVPRAQHAQHKQKSGLVFWRHIRDAQIYRVTLAML
jgi:sulfur carrier protein ThiS